MCTLKTTTEVAAHHLQQLGQKLEELAECYAMWAGQTQLARLKVIFPAGPKIPGLKSPQARHYPACVLTG